MEWDKEGILDLSSDKWTHNGCILKQVARERLGQIITGGQMKDASLACQLHFLVKKQMK